MKKIPTLFERTYENHKVVGITDKVTPGLEWVMNGEGVATVKYDGSCCAIINGELYKRYDAKKGRKPPEGAIPCCEPDPVTGHWPHWVKCDRGNPADRWFIEAYKNTFVPESVKVYVYGKNDLVDDGTYEAIGKHFQGNPYNLGYDMLVRHGMDKIEVARTFEGIRTCLERNDIEGIVFWKDGQPQCKIKRSDFGFEWPVKEG